MKPARISCWAQVPGPGHPEEILVVQAFSAEASYEGLPGCLIYSTGYTSKIEESLLCSHQDAIS